MKATSVPLVAAVTLGTIVSMVDYLKPCTIVIPALPATAVRVVARHWDDLRLVPVTVAATAFCHGLSLFIHDAASIQRVTDGNPRVAQELRWP
jgi:hypothetical protein